MPWATSWARASTIAPAGRPSLSAMMASVVARGLPALGRRALDPRGRGGAQRDDRPNLLAAREKVYLRPVVREGGRIASVACGRLASIAPGAESSTERG
jgi:hypothetical protein